MKLSKKETNAKEKLKNKLLQDRIDVQKKIIDSNDNDSIGLKDAFKLVLKHIETYIDICQKRNKF